MLKHGHSPSSVVLPLPLPVVMVGVLLLYNWRPVTAWEESREVEAARSAADEWKIQHIYIPHFQGKHSGEVAYSSQATCLTLLQIGGDRASELARQEFASPTMVRNGRATCLWVPTATLPEVIDTISSPLINDLARAGAVQILEAAQSCADYWQDACRGGKKDNHKCNRDRPQIAAAIVKARQLLHPQSASASARSQLVVSQPNMEHIQTFLMRSCCIDRRGSRTDCRASHSVPQSCGIR